MRAFTQRLRGSVVALALAGTVAGVGGVVVSTAALAATTSMTTTAWVNLRSGPGTDHPVLAVVPPSASVLATGGSDGRWLAVEYRGTSGWMSGAYLTPAAQPTTTTAPVTTAPASAGSVTTTADVNVRSGPGTSYSVVAVAARGTTVATTGSTSGTWTQVLWAGTPRWISTAYLAPAASTPAPNSGPTAPQSGIAAQVVAYAQAHVGYPYQVGSKGPDAFDCSGLVSAAYGSAGVAIPHSMSTQAATGTRIALADLRPGDVVVWGEPVTAVSLYVGDDRLIIADGPAYGVRQVSLSARLTWATFAGGRRYLA